MKKMYKLGVHTFYRPRNWGDGSDEPTWGDAAATEKEAAKEEQMAPVSHSRNGCGPRGASVDAPKRSQIALARLSHAPRKWLGSRIFVLAWPAEPLWSAPSAPDRSRRGCQQFGRSNLTMSVQSAADKSAMVGWRTPLVMLICGCLIGADQLRAALRARLVPDADVAGLSAGAATCSRWRWRSRYLLWGIGAAVRRRHRRPLRRHARAVGRRGALLRRPRADGLFDHAAACST